MTRILDKDTMINGRWIKVPFIRDEHGDRPAIPFDALFPAIPANIETKKEAATNERR